MKYDSKIESAFDAIKNIEKVEAPESMHAEVMRKVENSNATDNSYNLYLKWAAIGLLVLINMVSYVKLEGFQTEENIRQPEYQISDFVSEYGLNDYNDYNDYVE